MWHDVWAVIRREYLQRVRSKWFIAATIGGPLFMAGVIVVPAYFAAKWVTPNWGPGPAPTPSA